VKSTLQPQQIFHRIAGGDLRDFAASLFDR